MQRLKKVTYCIAAALTLILLILSFGVGNSAIVFAATDSRTAYERQNVLTDLTGSVIGGKTFDLADYPIDENGKIQLLSFVEYAYAYYAEQSVDYGLYVYIYNPQKLKFDINTPRNKIEFRVGKNTNYEKYPLEFLNYSAKAEYEGVFYKFKVNFTESQKTDLLNALNSESRIYEISGIELSVNNTVTDYVCAQKYTYSGYAQGYGSVLDDKESLSCVIDHFDRYLNPSVYHTVYRPKGDYYDGEQAQLNSCFFRLPNACFSDYGKLTKIFCEWEEYLTRPILVTENKDVFNAISSLYGGNVYSLNSKFDYLFQSIGNSSKVNWAQYISIFAPSYNKGDTLLWTSTIPMGSSYKFGKYNATWYKPWSWTDYSVYKTTLPEDKRFSNFAAVFYTGKDVSYKDYGPSASLVRQRLIDNTDYIVENYHNALSMTAEEYRASQTYAGRYLKALFSDSVENGHTRGYNKVEIKSDDVFDVYWNTTTKNFWQQHFSGGYNVETEWQSLNAFHKVTQSDITGSAAEIAARLYIDEADVETLKNEFNVAGDNETVMLCRYSTSSYLSMPMAQAIKHCGNYAPDGDYRKSLAKDAFYQCLNDNCTAYCAAETVFLDFDIIQFEFLEKDVKTVIPAVSSPTDAIGGLTPPMDENYHTGNGTTVSKLIALILGVLLLVVLFVFVLPYLVPLFAPVFRAIGNGIAAVVKAPFKLIAKLKSKKKE